MISNRSMPECTVIPEIGCPDVTEAAAWLCQAFGFTVRLRIANHRCQRNAGGGCALVLTESEASPHPQKTMVRVEDVDSHHHRAKSSGARILNAPADYPYGERQSTALDPADWGGTLSNPADSLSR